MWVSLAEEFTGTMIFVEPDYSIILMILLLLLSIFIDN